MPVARPAVNHLLGHGDVNHIQALKDLLGVEKLDVVVVESMQEYLIMIATNFFCDRPDTAAPQTTPEPDPA